MWGLLIPPSDTLCGLTVVLLLVVRFERVFEIKNGHVRLPESPAEAMQHPVNPDRTCYSWGGTSMVAVHLNPTGMPTHLRQRTYGEDRRQKLQQARTCQP